MAAPPASSSSGWSYDVFLSFRGEDTRKTITAHLYNALVSAGVHTFMDDVELRTGEEIGPELLSAIQQSRISIPIFSERYASSKWCLNELVKIVECRKTKNQLVLPIFYHVDPSHVRQQTGTYTEALQKHNDRTPQRIMEKWKEALSEVGALKGWDLKNIDNGNEGELIKLVVATVSSELEKDSLIVSTSLVGIQSHLEEMMNLLNIKSDDHVRIVGVWGLGGIGKTTIAKVIYNEISHHFEGCSFLENVGDTPLIGLQRQLVSEILKGVGLDIPNIDRGINTIKGRFCRKKVLIILDGVDEGFQLNALVGKRDWFGLGSRIIITTRDHHILINHGVDGIYEPSVMDEHQSLQLFSKHAFKRDQTPEDYLDLSRDIVKNTGGLPLALEVVGSSLFGVSKSAWQDTLKMLENDFLHDKVQKNLIISFEALNPLQKEIFLDIACFFNGMDKSIACLIWQQCNFYPELGIEVLRQKSLVKIGENNELKMHDLLRDLGKEIIRYGNRKMLRKLKAPGKRSRLWSHEEAFEVLEKHMGTDKVQGLHLDFGVRSGSQHCLMSEGFINMTKLRLLEVDYAHFAPGFMPSFSELTWFRWKGCPSKFTLTNFHPVNLVVLDLSDGVMTARWDGWNHLQVAKNLKVLNLKGCQYLLQTPKLINLRLEVLILENCPNLAQIDESINYLERLVTWNMRGCPKLRDLPYDIWGLTSLKNLNLHQCERLEELPDSIGHLKNLETFDASFCSIERIPDSMGWLSSLEILRLGGNNFHSLPVTVSSLSSLQTLDLRFCNELESLPELPSSLKCFNVLGCRSLESLPRFSNLTNLEELCLDDCDNLVKIPTLLGLRNLKRLNFDNCQSLTEIEGLEGLDSLDQLTIKGCKSLTKIPELSNLKELKVLELQGCENLLEIEGIVGMDSLELLLMKNFKSLWNIGKIYGLRKLKVIKVEDCPVLRQIDGLEGLDSLMLLTIERCRLLRILEIVECTNLLLIKGLEHLVSLERLSLYYCSSTTELPGMNVLMGLKVLDIRGCESMERLPDLSNFRKLKLLSIFNCGELKEIQGLHNLVSLETLVVGICKYINTLGDLSNLTNLKHLSTFYCVGLEEIQGLHRLESLETLDLTGCRSLERLPDLSNLRNLGCLSTFDCIKLKEIQGLDRLESLHWLDIRNCMSINRLPDLSNLRNLKNLPTGMGHKLTEIQVIKVMEYLKKLPFVNLNWLSGLYTSLSRKNPRLIEKAKMRRWKMQRLIAEEARLRVEKEELRCELRQLRTKYSIKMGENRRLVVEQEKRAVENLQVVLERPQHSIEMGKNRRLMVEQEEPESWANHYLQDVLECLQPSIEMGRTSLSSREEGSCSSK